MNIIEDIKNTYNCFLPKNKYNYLGYIYICFHENTIPYELILWFIKYVDKKAKKKYVPRWFLNLLYMYGRDNSIIRCRNRFLTYLHRKFTNGYLFHDIKVKYGELRIYGSFDNDCEEKIEEISKIVDNYYLTY